MSEAQRRLLGQLATLRTMEGRGAAIGFRSGCFMAHKDGLTWEAIAVSLGTTPAALRRRLDRIYEEVHAT